MDLQRNADRFTGQTYIDIYDRFRPSPPVILLQQCLNYLDRPKAKLVVDLGCGTGISTIVWSPFTEKVIGIEPCQEMIERAQLKEDQPVNVRYIQAYGHALSLEQESVDILACSQSFHWMNPQPTLREIHRVLKQNGVLMIYDVIWPPSVHIKWEQAYHRLFQRAGLLTQQLEETVAHK